MALRVKGIASDDLSGTVKTVALALTQMEREADRNRRTGAVKRAATDRRSAEFLRRRAERVSSPLNPL
eukprot:4357285-Prymnesium_polylepis.1